MASKAESGSNTLKFPDKNLQLALLDEIQTNPLWLPTHEADYEGSRGSHPTWPTWAAIRDAEKTHNQALEQYLLSVGVPEEGLKTLDTLVLDRDREIYGWIYSFWWESGEHFVIRDLSGLEACESLESLELDHNLVQGCSLEPLGKLKQLKSLTIDAEGGYSNVDALLESSGLQKLILSNSKTDAHKAQWDGVVDALCERGLPSLSRT
jgi:hypothetical protein